MGKLCDDASLAISQKFSLVAPSEDLSVKVHDGKLWKVDGRLVVPASMLPINKDSLEWLDVEVGEYFKPLTRESLSVSN